MVMQSVSRMQVSECRLTEQNGEELVLILGWMFLTDSVDVRRRGSEDTLEEHWRRGDTGESRRTLETGERRARESRR